MRADFLVVLRSEEAEDSDTPARRCVLWTAMPAEADFCSICVLAGAAASVTNTTDSKISVMRNVIWSAAARRELFLVGFMGRQG